MTTPAELILVRHGRAHCNDAGTIAGPSCTGLTPTGRGQATATARRLASGGVTAVHTSTTPRAHQTAHIIAGTLNLPVTSEPDLRVPDPGQSEGQSWPEARGRWPRDPHNPTRPVAPDSEEWTAYLRRATDALDTLLENHPGGTIVLVGHHETLSAILHLLLNVSNLGRMRLAFDHCALTTWQATAEWPGVHALHQRWTLQKHNDASHLVIAPGQTRSRPAP